MPKLKPSKTELCNRRTRGMIKKYQEYLGYSNKDMAILMGISPSLYKKRLDDPSQIKLEEARPLVKKMNDQDKAEFIGAL